MITQISPGYCISSKAFQRVRQNPMTKYAGTYATWPSAKWAEKELWNCGYCAQTFKLPGWRKWVVFKW